MNGYSIKRKFAFVIILFAVVVAIVQVVDLSLFLSIFVRKEEVRFIDSKREMINQIYNFESKKLKNVSNYFSSTFFDTYNKNINYVEDIPSTSLMYHFAEKVPQKWSQYFIVILNKRGEVLASYRNPNFQDQRLSPTFCAPSFQGDTFTAVDIFPKTFLEQENIQHDIVFYACSPIYSQKYPSVNGFVMVGLPLNEMNPLIKKINRLLGENSITNIFVTADVEDVTANTNFVFKNAQNKASAYIPIKVGQTNLHQLRNDIILRIVIIGITTLLISVLVSWLGSNWIISPIMTLQKFMGDLEDGDYTKKLSVRWNDRLSMVFNQFNTLSEKIRELVEKERAYSAKLDRLNDVRKEISGILELDTLIEELVKHVVDMVDCYRCSIWVYDSKRKLLICKGGNYDFKIGEKNRVVNWGKGIVGKVIKKGGYFYIKNVSTQLKGDVPEEYVGAGSLFSIALMSRTEVIGVMNVSKEEIDGFHKETIDMLSALAGQAGVAIQNAIVYGEVSERERFKEEMEIARDIQMRLLPKSVPRIRNISLTGKTIPAREVGGDYYDFIETQTGEEVRLIIGDVSGKGVSAGLIMMRARTVLHSLAHHIESPKQTLVTLNKLIEAEIGTGKFMTMLYLKWDGNSRKLKYASAGHEHILVYRSKDKSCKRIKSGGLAIGLISELSPILKEEEIELEPGDGVVLYTDGVTEARNDWGDLYGLDRLQLSVSKHGEKTSNELQQALLMELYSFIGRTEQYDDITMLVLKVTS